MTEVEFTEDYPGRNIEFDADPSLKPVKLSAVKESMGMPSVQIKAEALIDKTFVIRSASSFVSTLGQGNSAYYCVCVMPDTGELFSTVLGGRAVVDLLDLYFQSGEQASLEVTLRKIAGGRFGRYYTLE